MIVSSSACYVPMRVSAMPKVVGFIDAGHITGKGTLHGHSPGRHSDPPREGSLCRSKCPAPFRLWKSFRAHRENDSGLRENRSPSRWNRRSRSARNPVHLQPGTLFTFTPESRSPCPGIRNDNTKLAVAQILGDGTRTKTRAFTELQSHYLFAEKFGRPGKGNDKGKVEGLVGYARRNFLVPVPRCASWEELNARLLEQCARRRERKLRGHDETIGERFKKDKEMLLPLPAAPYEACEKRTTRVTSMSLVRYRANDYSGPCGDIARYW